MDSLHVDHEKISGDPEDREDVAEQTPCELMVLRVEVVLLHQLNPPVVEMKVEAPF